MPLSRGGFLVLKRLLGPGFFGFELEELELRVLERDDPVDLERDDPEGLLRMRLEPLDLRIFFTGITSQ